MKKNIKIATIILLFVIVFLSGVIVINDASHKQGAQPMYRELTKAQERVIVDKGTEAPFTGEYENNFAEGDYYCRRCDSLLYHSASKFRSNCGWPSFDDEVKGAVKRIPDKDGLRIEIVCANCQAHLGHVFTGEGFTSKNTRHCVNSISMIFKPAKKEILTSQIANRTAVFAGGCFWGVEYYLEKLNGVKDVASGYIGGTKENPTYEEVCTGKTGYIEAVEVTYDPSIISYREVAMTFFEIHDPTQLNRQGPDIGEQYQSAIFVTTEDERQTIKDLISILEGKGLKVATKIRDASKFWPAEKYHQNYYDKKGSLPYCHGYVKRF